MKITVVGAVLIFGAVTVVVLVFFVLSKRREEGGPQQNPMQWPSGNPL
jgi:hypothetical protein